MDDYERIARVIRHLDEHYLEQPRLDDLAELAGLSPSHFHRLFSRWAGITPKDFLQSLTLSHAKEALRAGRSVLDAALDAGLSGPGRLHDLCVSLEAASAGEMKSGGEGWTIHAGFADSPFGTCLIAESPRGICHLSFVSSRDQEQEGVAIASEWPHARVVWDLDAAGIAGAVFARPAQADRESPLRVFISGSQFQCRVWRALLRIPPGALTSYAGLASALGDGGAARAVGNAVAKNRVAYLIPCHRVIRETGALGSYRWGATRKRAIVAWEGAPSSMKEATG